MSKGIDLKAHIREFPDWPKEGIIFRDITPILLNPRIFTAAIDALCANYYHSSEIEIVAAVESRGFIFGASIADRLGAGFVPIRKKGKLPGKVQSITYDLEYGTDTLEICCDAIEHGSGVLMVDDLLATGGTMYSACRLIERVGGKVAGISFLIELAYLKGREKLNDYKVTSVVSYD
ncbi:MAG: adenine phosphoribosyltransferase [Sedimentisphaerales bacterium]|nr:adenine phosphoribosyltransferase [Sedimentisphaerales bacterium]